MSATVFTEEEFEALEDSWGAPRFLMFPVGVFVMWCIAVRWPVDHWAVLVPTLLLSSYLYLCWTSCFHECAHQTLCQQRWISIWFGRLIGMILFLPYTIYRESHIRHHAYLNKPTDWELWPYSDPNASLAFRRVFVWIDLVFGYFTGPIVYSRIFFHRDSPITSSKLRRTIRREFAASAVFWSVTLGTIAWYGLWMPFLFVWVIPTSLAGVYQTARKLTEHLGMASYDPLLGTRTVVGESLVTRACTYLNFDIFVHGPHHRHPKIAHNRLGSTMDDYVRQNPDVDYPVFRTYLAATWNMLPWIFRNPGVGMNVGAPPPDGGQPPDVEDFVADVNDAILSGDTTPENGARERQPAPHPAPPRRSERQVQPS